MSRPEDGRLERLRRGIRSSPPLRGSGGRILAVAATAALLAACGSSSTGPGRPALAPAGPVAAVPATHLPAAAGSARSSAAPASGPGAGLSSPVPWFGVNPAEPLLGSAGSPAGPAAGTVSATAAAMPFPGGLLVADRGNGRILILGAGGRIRWSFPGPGSLPRGQAFSADDAFISPDGKTIVANDEFHQVVDRIDLATRRIVWQYGHYGVPGSAPGFLDTPDDAYPLANGDITVADIFNCRILEIAPDKTIVRQWGRTRVCADHAPTTFGSPNGDTPLPDGGMLITEITGSRVVRLSASGAVVFDIRVPVAYPSDAQLTPEGNVIVADFSSPGQVVEVSPTGKLIWRYGPSSGPGKLDHPSLATPLPGGLVSVNDDFRHRIVVIDPVAGRIVWQYGKTDVQGRAANMLDTPDGHEPLPPGMTF